MNRPIVVSARRYYPPGDSRLSRYHLYRCTPEGTRWIQLTNSRVGDYQPVWSPNGRWIFFQRVEKPWTDSLTFGDRLRTQLCLIRPDGSGFLTFPSPEPKIGTVDAKWMGYRHIWIRSSTKLSLLDLKIGKYIKEIQYKYEDDVRNFDFSPDRKYFSLGGKVYNFKTNKIIFETANRSLLFIDNENILSDILGIYKTNGKNIRSINFKFDNIEGLGYLSYFDKRNKRFVWIQEIIKDKWYSRGTYLADLSSGAVRTYDMGWDPAFSPDGARFIGPGERDTTSYGARPNGAPRAVFTVPLIGGIVGKDPKTLCGGLIEVDSCDWRS